MQEMPIFPKMFELMVWLLQVTNHFPRSQRYFFNKRLLDAVFDLHEYLEEANHRRGAERIERLERADEVLDRLRMYIRLAWRLKWLDEGQYGHVSVIVVEIGKLLGGWRKATV